VFGQVVHGDEVIHLIEGYGNPKEKKGSKPTKIITISDCGEHHEEIVVDGKHFISENKMF
jgi:hypothetical protein